MGGAKCKMTKGSGPDFSEETKAVLARRAGQRCSNPNCQQPTSGPHTDETKAVNIGEAAHIRGARPGSARCDASMTDEERRDIGNGIWLCRTCAKLIDSDEQKYTVDLLNGWKRDHEQAVLASKPHPPPAKEITVKDGGVGSIVQNSGDGTAEEILHDGPGPAEKVTVEGHGVGEVVVNTGKGTAKRIVSTGGGSALESGVQVTGNVRKAVGLSSTLIVTTCSACGEGFTISKVVAAFAGNEEPKVGAKCPHCGASQRV